MLRNLSMNIFILLVILGYFNFIPNYLLVLIIFAFIFDAAALYLSTQKNGKKIYNKNPDIKKLVDIYLEYSKPTQKYWLWFFIDRYVFSILLLILIIYYYLTYGLCKIF